MSIDHSGFSPAGYQGISVINEVPPSGDTSGIADTFAINQAVSSGGLTQLLEGQYYINGPLSMITGAILAGYGMSSTVINQVSTSAAAITATDQRYLSIRDLTLQGPGTGTGRGIALLHSASALASVDIRNVYIKNFGGNGVFADTLITSKLSNVRAENCGGDNFFIQNSTSVKLDNCYANHPSAGTASGYRLNNCRYLSLDACAADGVTTNNGAYFIQGGNGIALNGCGCETPAVGYKCSSSAQGIVFNACRVLSETSVGFLITSTTTGVTLISPVELTPNGATASIEVDTGSSAVVIMPNVVTAQSYAAGTAFVITQTGGVAH